jgi:uncharacterized protein (DUF1684 family)
MTELETFRRQKDRYFRTGPDSPIPHEQRANFAGLAYYPENAGLRLVLQPEEFAEKDAIQMITSTGGVQEYQRWGRFGFEADGQPAELTIYYATWGGFFVPFVDATSGGETYGAGRYLELEPLDDGSFLADFNLAYNPYCAYSEDFSCPIPPAENRIAAPVRAGEMQYHDHC